MGDVKTLRGRTGAGIINCKKALVACDGDIDGAIDWLRAKGLSSAAKKAGRVAAEGVVASYIHGNGRIGVLVEINSETDFAAQTAEFQNLVKEVSLQIAAHSADFVSIEDIPEAERAKEHQLQLQRLAEDPKMASKPPQVLEAIVTGRMRKWYEQVCLLEQPYFREEDKKIKDLVTEYVAKLGENIRVRRFVRYTLGEGIEKREDNFAAEVAAQVGMN
jgi:elongation factor Ts